MAMEPAKFDHSKATVTTSRTDHTRMIVGNLSLFPSSPFANGYRWMRTCKKKEEGKDTRESSAYAQDQFLALLCTFCSQSTPE